MKNPVYAVLAALAIAGTVVAQSASTSFPKLDVGVLDAGTITADSIVLPYSTFKAGPATVTTNAAVSQVYRTLTTNGWLYITNSIAGSVVTQANVITAGYIAGKAGIRLDGAGSGTYSITIAAPGSTIAVSQPSHTEVYRMASTNASGWTYVTNTITGYTNTYPAAAIGSKLTIVNGSAAATMSLTSGSTILPASQTISLAPNGMVTLTAVSGAYWQMAEGYVAGVGTTFQAYDADLTDLADGSLTASKVAAGYAAAGLVGSVPLASLTNAFTGLTGTLITNTTIAATGQTNTYVFAPVGDSYVLKSISTSAP